MAEAKSEADLRDTSALFSPADIGGLRLSNRLAALPVFTGYAHTDGRVSPLLLEHYRRLADSGVALVVIGNLAVAPNGATSAYNLRLDRDAYVPGLARLVRTIHEAGALACVQLNHAGRFAKTETPLMPAPMDALHLAFDMASLKAFVESFPIEERFGLTWMVMRKAAAWQGSMTREQRSGVVRAFGEAADRAVAAGFDLVELHGATGYLLAEFLSSYTNKPVEGGFLPLAQRAAFPLEVVAEVRRRLPPRIPLGFRLLVREWTPDGVDLAEALDFGALLEAAGLAYLSVSAGTYNSIFNPEVRRQTARPAYLREECAALKARVRIPVIGGGKILTPRLAARLLDAGQMDLVGLGRPLLADPDWVRKARSGVPVTACADCMACLKRIVLEQGLNCVRRPAPLRKHVDLEYAFLNRNASRVLVAATCAEDLDLLRERWRQHIPAGEEASATVLFLHPEGGDVPFGLAREQFMAWSREMWRDLGLPAGQLRHEDRTLRGAPEDFLLEEAEAGGFGVLTLCRKRGEPWRRRVLQRRRENIAEILGRHPAQDKVLVPFDASPASLLVLRHVAHAWGGQPPAGLTFLHVAEDNPGQALEAFNEAKDLLGWDAAVPLTVVSRRLGPSGDILEMVRSQHYGAVVMGRRGQSGLRRLLLGSVSAAVLLGLTTQSLTLVA